MSLPGILIIFSSVVSFLFCLLTLWFLFNYLSRFALRSKYRIFRYLKLTHIAYFYLFIIILLSVGSVIFYFNFYS